MKLFNFFRKKQKNTKFNSSLVSGNEDTLFKSRDRIKEELKTDDEFLLAIMDLGWEFTFFGAECPYFDKDIYRLQVIGQSLIMPSVFNQNYGITGKQNLIIFTKNGFHNIFFGYAETKEELEQVFKLLKI